MGEYIFVCSFDALVRLGYITLDTDISPEGLGSKAGHEKNLAQPQTLFSINQKL